MWVKWFIGAGIISFVWEYAVMLIGEYNHTLDKKDV